MGYKKKSKMELLLLYGLLIAFSAIFLFPFLWMMSTSIKTQREMSTDRLQVIPTTPEPHYRIPYFDKNEFIKFTVPDDIPDEIWKQVLPELKIIIKNQVSTWTPKLSGVKEEIQISELNMQEYNEAMERGLLLLLSDRISDKTRVIAKEALLPISKKQNKEKLKNANLAIISNAEKLITDAAMEDIFNRCFRRFSLGEVKIRSDYKIMPLNSKNGWSAISSNSALKKATAQNKKFNIAEINFKNSKEGIFLFKAELDKTLAKIDRIFISYQGDASWARIYFEVIKDGKVYKTEDIVNLHDQNWAEAELRWKEENSDEMSRKAYYILHDTEKQEKTGVMFAVKVIVIKSTPLLAWYDKILRNYRNVFREIPFFRYILTSLSLCILNIILTVFSCTITAYAFSRLEWPGRDTFFGIMLATMMLPAQVTMIPSFLIIKNLGLYNTLLPLWIFSAFGNAFFIFLLRQFFKTIPKDLEDAAKIDGCGFFGIYWHVMLPLVRPTIATIAIFTFMGTWNNFMGALIYVNDERLFPLALGLFKFNLISGSDIGLMMAGSFIMTLPIIIIFFFAQRYFIQGISLTGTKG